MYEIEWGHALLTSRRLTFVYGKELPFIITIIIKTNHIYNITSFYAVELFPLQKKTMYRCIKTRW